MAQAARTPEPTLLEGESADIHDDIRKLIPEPDTWLGSPNSQLGMKSPREILNTGDEQRVRELLRLIAFIGVS